MVSKPKFNALFAIGVFLILSYSLGLVNAGIVINDEGKWYNYAIALFLLPLATVILIKQVVGYKVVLFKNQTFIIKKPFLFTSYRFKIRDITSWQETIIKTKSGNFRELSIQTDNSKPLKLTLQENTNYEKFKNYMAKKLPKKEVKQNHS